MVEEEHTDPLEITKDPIILKAAQVELSKLDILVCGECHEVFHFIEELQEHRLQNKCTKESVLKECIQTESKSQVWGFMLWKNAKFKNVPNDTTHPTSWTVYQLWCNLEQTQKNAWITAGKSLQNIYTISTANLQPPLKAVPTKPVKTVLSTPYRKDDDEPENLEEGEIRTKKKLKPTSNDSSKLDSEQDPLADTESDIDIEEEIDKERAKQNKCENGGIKKTILKPVQLNSDVTILPSTKKGTSKRAIRSNNDDKKIEYVVEKIISKRYNPGKKTHEYLVKWEDFDEEQNTWEPIAHLDSCKQLTEEFDRNLQKLKAQKLAKSPLVQRRVYRKSLPENNANLILSTAVGRPQRTSKQKALNQVKVWCGNMSDADEGSNKRSYSDSDSDSFEKKMKLEPESSDSEDDRPVVTVKRVMKSALNGIGRRQPLPENILVPDAQGIVRINQKQLPALSSGVYVMSKTAGIIKLDSNTSKIAASGGHAVIKVAPKIGQTSIKVVKREASNGSKPNIITRVKQPMKAIAAKVIAHRKGPAPAILRKAEPIKIEVKQEDEESDGLEELPFPTDLPLPEPDSPPGDFTLCPLTGRILGQDEKHPRNDEISQDVNTSSDNTDNTLDNLVNLAAADILNESPVDEKVETEVKNDEKDKSVSDLTEPIVESVAEESKLCKNEKPDKTQTIEEALSAMEADDIPVATTSSASSTSSILSTALSNANIEPTANVNAQKKVVTTTESIRQKTAMNRSIINRTIVPKPAPQAIITRITPGTINRHKQLINKSKMGAPPPTFRKTIRQTYSNKHSIIRKIGSTSVYQSSPTTSQPSQQSVSTTESLVQTLSATSPPGVINMPLLTDVESPSTSTNIQDVKAEPDPEPEPAPPTENTDTDINAISLTDSETPLLITGEDGTIYQVAGQNEDGQTILIAQDADGQQQCLLVASESGSDLAEPEVVNTPVEAEIPDQMEEEPPVNTEQESDNAEDSQIVAQIVSAQPPSPGGTRKVVLMLPDGNLMMTEVTAEQYAALELDK